MNYDELFVNINELPELISSDEILNLFNSIKSGDIKSRNTLIESNIRLVLYEVNKRFKSVDYDKKELVSIGIMGLIKAVDTFDVSKSYKFSTYALRCIDNEILMFLRKLNKDIILDSLNRSFNEDTREKQLFLEDIISDNIDIEEEYIKNETKDEVNKIISSLPNKEKKIIMLYFGYINDRRYTQSEIANIMSFSSSYVSKIINNTINKIRLIQNNEVIKIRRIKTIYEYFSDYSKEEVDKIISELSDKDKSILKLRYGDDLDNPISNRLSKEKGNIFYCYLIPKIRKMLEKPCKERKIRKVKTIYEYFNKYSREEIDNVISNLDDKDKSILYMRYGNDLDNPISKYLTEEERYQFYNGLMTKIRRKLEKPYKSKKQRKIKTIYEYFNEYSKEYIDKVIDKLSEEEKKLIYYRYGNDLVNPIFNSFSDEQSNAFYGLLLPKMRRMVDNPNKYRKSINVKNIYEFFNEYTKEDVDSVLNRLSDEERYLINKRFGGSELTKEDKYKFSHLLIPKMRRILMRLNKTSNINNTLVINNIDFNDFIKRYPSKEFMIVNLMYSKSLSVGEISELMNINVDEVINIVKKILLEYKNYINNIINNMIELDNVKKKTI